MIPEPILLVDDEDDLRGSLAEFLTQDGYRVEEADSFESAMALIGRQHFPVILTDLNMPGGPSGLELISRVKAKDPKALCVVMTGFATLDASIRALKNGAYDFIQKPFKLAELEAVLDRALDHAQLRLKLESYQADLESRVLARTQAYQGFQEEVFVLNELLVKALSASEEGALVLPFLDYCTSQFKPDGLVALAPGPQGWEILHRRGNRPWAAFGSIPPPEHFTGILDWGWEGGYPEGYLLPLAQDGQVLGALFLGYELRSAFHPEDPLFVLWRKQLEAALFGLYRGRMLVEAALSRARGARE